jgi:hypothetical protein
MSLYRRPAQDYASGVNISRHAVHFYESEAAFADGIAPWLAEGLRAGDACLVVATAAHRTLLAGRLKEPGVAWPPASYLAMDAAETLARFCIEGFPDEWRFASVVGEIVEEMKSKVRRPLRIYGEMVSLLVADGRVDAAIALERMWNRLTEAGPFSLTCSYPLREFQTESRKASMQAICLEHGAVRLPAA